MFGLISVHAKSRHRLLTTYKSVKSHDLARRVCAGTCFAHAVAARCVRWRFRRAVHASIICPPARYALATRPEMQAMQIGPYKLKNNLVLAPMAGVTDRPFRQLCKQLGAGMAVSEMVSSNSLLWGSAKTQRRANHEGETEPKSVQIAGADPQMMAQAARYNADQGAQIIDINMGCPAKKVCNVMAGSALLQNEALVGQILDAVIRQSISR